MQNAKFFQPSAQMKSPVSNMSVLFDLDTNKKIVEITLSGTILGEQSKSLKLFLSNLVKNYRGNRWVLKVDELDMISGRNLLFLKKFACSVGKRGQVVEIAGMQPYLRATLHDLKLNRYFTPCC